MRHKLFGAENRKQNEGDELILFRIHQDLYHHQQQFQLPSQCALIQRQKYWPPNHQISWHQLCHEIPSQRHNRTPKLSTTLQLKMVRTFSSPKIRRLQSNTLPLLELISHHWSHAYQCPFQKTQGQMIFTVA